ncbi:maleylacetoacetate isomerase [Paludibacterium paludis]|uniref:Maleylacetoacetate isomerase n=1 Tax=Paludibacterium paludis TaxID=1225769 RepID=A0A918U9K4_9NEIS|nr:maleylacetoacetate isomerase [Paludibacterium paludis]GGY14275.1 maleylacetoacetate isomerase [Paludibacterium paludis]
MTERVLYGYFRSSAAYRVRLALNLKGLDYRQEAVNLLKGEQQAQHYLGINPQGLVPALADGPIVLTQSLAICEYLDEAYPATHRLLPGDAAQRAAIRAIALAVACDIHPLNNTRVLKYLTAELSLDDESRDAWYRHWVTKGLGVIERMVEGSAGRYAIGNSVTLADVCLVPQLFNAWRFNVDTSRWPTLERIDAALAELPAFRSAHPSQQADFVG